MPTIMLFETQRFGEFCEEYRQAILGDLAQMTATALMEADPDRLAAKLANRHVVHCPRLLEDRIGYTPPPLDENTLRRISNGTVSIRVTIPFVGDFRFFRIALLDQRKVEIAGGLSQDHITAWFDVKCLAEDHVEVQVLKSKVDALVATINSKLADLRRSAERVPAALLDFAKTEVIRRRPTLATYHALVQGLAECGLKASEEENPTAAAAQVRAAELEEELASVG